MDKSRFKGILNEFPLEFDGLEVLAKELRDILFPYREGLFTGTYRDPEKLYRPIIVVAWSRDRVRAWRLAPHLVVCRRPSPSSFFILGIFVRIAE